MLLTTWAFQIPDAPSLAAWSLAWAGARATWRSRKLVTVVAIVVLAAELTIALMLFGVPVVSAVALAPVAAVLLLAVVSVGVWRRDIRHPASRVLVTPVAVAVAAARAKRRGGVEVWKLVNHSALRPGRRQGRAFRMVLWPDLGRAVTAGVDVCLRASHWRVHGLYLRELHELGLTLQRVDARRWYRIAHRIPG